MSNTYFKIKSINEHAGVKNDPVFKPYTNSYHLSLTAFVSNSKTVQLTVQTQSTISSQNGVAFITLSEQDCLKLIGALTERLTKKISATGNEESIFTQNEEE